ncbi:glycosyltransferase family 1 protein, partial [Micromonospora mangrovi]
MGPDPVGRRAPVRCRPSRAAEQLQGGRMSPDADVIDIHPARHQRVLILSWEYPPVLVGGLGR